MAEVKDMYKIARFINAGDRKVLNFPKTQQSAINGCAESYGLSRPWRSENRAHDWLENAIAHKYVKVEGDDDRGYWLKVTPGRGMQLIAKHWLIFRVGLREQTLKEYPHTVTMYKSLAIAVIGLLSTAIGAVAGAVVTYTLTR